MKILKCSNDVDEILLFSKNNINAFRYKSTNVFIIEFFNIFDSLKLLY